tara:strand:- start:5435 stop:5842 length:408 start_codon:yes stop_codon:yes gene_type:complete
MNFYNALKYIAIGLSLLAVIFLFVILFGNLFGVDLMLFNAYFILFIIVSAVLFFGISNVISDRLSLMNTLKLLGTFLGLFLVCFLLASGEETIMKEGKVLSALSSKFIGAALFMFYALVIIASGSMLYFGIKNRK